MGRKSRNKEELDFSISIKGKYKNNIGVTEMEEINGKGNSAILVSACLSFIAAVCEDNKVDYCELLSNEIKRKVYDNAIKKTEKMREEENNGK